MGHKSLAHVQRGTEHRWFLSVDWSDRVLLPQISSYHIFHFVIYFQFSPLLRADSLYRQFADNASFALSSFRRLLRFILNNFSIFQLYSCVADGYLQFRNFLWIGDEATKEVEANRTKGTNMRLRTIEAIEKEKLCENLMVWCWRCRIIVSKSNTRKRTFDDMSFCFDFAQQRI